MKCELWQRLPDKLLPPTALIEAAQKLAIDIGAHEIIEILEACAVDSGKQEFASGNHVDPETTLDSIRHDIQRLNRGAAIGVKATKNEAERCRIGVTRGTYEAGYSHGHYQGEQLAYGRVLLILDMVAERLSRQGGN